jgi:hypothetical protein
MKIKNPFDFKTVDSWSLSVKKEKTKYFFENLKFVFFTFTSGVILITLITFCLTNFGFYGLLLTIGIVFALGCIYKYLEFKAIINELKKR